MKPHFNWTCFYWFPSLSRKNILTLSSMCLTSRAFHKYQSCVDKKRLLAGLTLGVRVPECTPEVGSQLSGASLVRMEGWGKNILTGQPWQWRAQVWPVLPGVFSLLRTGFSGSFFWRKGFVARTVFCLPAEKIFTSLSKANVLYGFAFLITWPGHD